MSQHENPAMVQGVTARNLRWKFDLSYLPLDLQRLVVTFASPER